jgi:hypothetical protein
VPHRTYSARQEADAAVIEEKEINHRNIVDLRIFQFPQGTAEFV